jgi:hypothetical protein
MFLKNVKTYGAVWTKLSLAFFFFSFFQSMEESEIPAK